MVNEQRVLIYFDDVVNALIKEYGEAMDLHLYSPREIVESIGSVDRVDAVPVVHGRWINERMLRGGFAEVWGWDCSCCGETIEDRDKLPNFCPNCGAKMDGERKEE